MSDTNTEVLDPPTQPESAPPPPPGSPVATSAPAAGQPGWLFFKKVMFATPFFIDRKPVAFEQLDQNTGVLKIAAVDPQASGLLAAAQARRGGIVLIDEPTYDSLKKKLPFKPLAPKSKRHVLQAFQTEPPARPPRNQNGVAVGGNPRISGRPGVGPVGGGGTGGESGKMPPVPAPPPAAPGEFVPSTRRKSEIKLPVTKKASGHSLRSLAPDEPETAPAE